MRKFDWTSGKSLLACAVMLLAGCAPTGPFNRLRDGETNIPAAKGVLVFSSVKEHEHSIMWDYVVTSSVPEKTGVLGREFRLPTGFYDLPCGRIGNIIAASLEPGSYEFGPWTVNVSATVGAAGILVTTRKSDHGPPEAKFPVEVRPGQITYIGEVRVDQDANTARITDQWACDSTYLQQTWPALTTWHVDHAIRQFPMPGDATKGP